MYYLQFLETVKTGEHLVKHGGQSFSIKPRKGNIIGRKGESRPSVADGHVGEHSCTRNSLKTCSRTLPF